MTFNDTKFKKDLHSHWKQSKLSLEIASEDIGIGSSTLSYLMYRSTALKQPSIEIILKCIVWIGGDINNYINHEQNNQRRISCSN